jgi:hypothetical protein
MAKNLRALTQGLEGTLCGIMGAFHLHGVSKMLADLKPKTYLLDDADKL